MSGLNYLNKAILLLFIFGALLYYSNITINERNKKLEQFGDAIVYDVILNTNTTIRNNSSIIFKTALSDPQCIDLTKIPL